jgi:hypothetical protein
MKTNITFNSSAKRDILKFFDKEINNEGIIVESSSKEKVLGLDGTDIYETEFAGIKAGSEIFLKKDLISMMKLVDETKNEFSRQS